jgi:hypothetical protein
MKDNNNNINILPKSDVNEHHRKYKKKGKKSNHEKVSDEKYFIFLTQTNDVTINHKLFKRTTISSLDVVLRNHLESNCMQL